MIEPLGPLGPFISSEAGEGPSWRPSPVFDLPPELPVERLCQLTCTVPCGWFHLAEGPVNIKPSKETKGRKPFNFLSSTLTALGSALEFLLRIGSAGGTCLESSAPLRRQLPLGRLPRDVCAPCSAFPCIISFLKGCLFIPICSLTLFDLHFHQFQLFCLPPLHALAVNRRPS